MAMFSGAGFLIGPFSPILGRLQQKHGENGGNPDLDATFDSGTRRFARTLFPALHNYHVALAVHAVINLVSFDMFSFVRGGARSETHLTA